MNIVTVIPESKSSPNVINNKAVSAFVNLYQLGSCVFALLAVEIEYGVEFGERILID
jgi:hypothetical protein